MKTVVLACALVIALPTVLFGQEHMSISLEFQHSLRIPNSQINIDLIQTPKIVIAKVISNPGTNDPIWNHTRKDTSFQIPMEDFERILALVKRIPVQEIFSKIEPSETGHDGTTGIIRFGNYEYEIAICVWTPNHKSKDRGTEEFLTAFKEILKAGGFKPNKIL